MSTETDSSLKALQNGDRQAFAHFMEMNSAKIYRLALKMTGNPQDAEDILQETFLKAYRGIKNFAGRSSLSTWLYRIATNEALMSLRKKQLSTVSLDEPLVGEEGEQEPRQIVDWCCLPEKELLSTETRHWLDKAIGRLSPALRVVFLLRDVEGLSTLEAAQALDLSEEAVKTRLSRARMRLREDLSVYFGEQVEKQNNGA
ncbi:MAG: RNA polymerase sigma factor [Chloroflexota bacterium]